MRVLLPAILLALAACGREPAGGPAAAPPGPPATTSSPGPGEGRRGPGLAPQQTPLALPVARTADLSYVQPAPFAAALNNDPARIFAFVRDNIAYETYAGALRGPRGTLLAMAGNSIDRASLLAELLRHAGMEVRFAKGALPDAAARQLVASMWADRPAARAADAGVAPSAALTAARDSLLVSMTRDYRLIRDQLKTAGLNPPPPAAPGIEGLASQAREHVWVQRLDGTRWIDLDPSFADAAPGRAYASAAETFAALPEALFHRVEIRVRVDESAGGESSHRVVLTYKAKAADLSGVALILAHQPERWTGPAANIQAGVTAAMQDNGRIKPVIFAGADVVSGEAFRQRPAAGVGSIGGLLGGAGSRHPDAVAAAEAIEVAFIRPDGHAESVTRDIFDVIGPAARTARSAMSADEIAERAQSGDAADLTSRVFSLFFTTGAVASSNTLDVRPRADDDGRDIAGALTQIGWMFCATSDAISDQLGALTPSRGRFYFDSPRLVIVDASRTRAGAYRVSVDLRRDAPRLVAQDPGNAAVPFVRVARGVADGTLERVLIDYLLAASPDAITAVRPRIGTSALFDAAAARHIAPVMLAPGRPVALPAIPADARARLNRDLDAGYIAIAPTGTLTVDGVQRYAWWRVDPKSGETIAVADDGGYGQEFEAVVRRGENNTQTVDLYYVGTFQRVLVQTINPARFPGGIAALLQLLRNEGWLRNFRPFP